jgi:hypothetical protein
MTLFDPLSWKNGYLLEQSAESKRDAVCEENLVILVFELILKLKAVVGH